MASLFASLASSEQVHARNFKKAAAKLWAKLKEPPDFALDVYSTKINFKTQSIWQ
ncbi:MAG: hypothetical protein HQL27_04985 [Candidatus Omnitrophica bacterium]|nr:hypothetical protein [Candidatus Omnitrophota bacterium]